MHVGELEVSLALVDYAAMFSDALAPPRHPPITTAADLEALLRHDGSVSPPAAATAPPSVGVVGATPAVVSPDFSPPVTSLAASLSDASLTVCIQSAMQLPLVTSPSGVAEAELPNTLVAFWVDTIGDAPALPAAVLRHCVLNEFNTVHQSFFFSNACGMRFFS